MDLPVVFVGHRAFDGMSVSACLPLHSIITCDGGATTALIEQTTDIQVTSLEDITALRERWTSSDLTKLILAGEQELRRLKSPVDVLPYAGSHPWSSLTRVQNVRSVLSPKADIRRRFDDKRSAKRLFQTLDLPVIPGIVAPLSDESISAALAYYGFPLVIRASMGSTGSNVFRFRDMESLTEWLNGLEVEQKRRQWLLEKNVTGLSLNVNAVVVGEGTVAFPVSIQLIGEGTCSDLPLGFCGNDFTTAERLPLSVKAECTRTTLRIGMAMAAAGYQGVFGVDLIAHDDSQILPCEINARFQNSTALINFALSATHNLTPAWLHAQSFKERIAQYAYPDDSSHQTVGLNQAILYTPSLGATAKVLASVSQGFYQIENDNLGEYLRPGLDPRRLHQNEILVTSSPPAVGVRVAPGAALLKLVSRRAITDDTAGGMLPWIQGVVQQCERSISRG